MEFMWPVITDAFSLLIPFSMSPLLIFLCLCRESVLNASTFSLMRRKKKSMVKTLSTCFSQYGSCDTAERLCRIGLSATAPPPPLLKFSDKTRRKKAVAQTNR